MESTNFHHHQHRDPHQHGYQLQLQLQDDQERDHTSSLAPPSWYLASSNNLHASWTLNNQSLIRANYFNNEHLNEENLCNNNTRDSRRENDLFVPSSVDLSSSSSNNSSNNNSTTTTSTTTTTTNSMIPDLGFQYWSTNNNNNHLSDSAYPKFTEMLCSSAQREDQFNHQYDHHSSSYGGILGNANNNNIPTGGHYRPIILPSINISNLNPTAVSRASSENISSSLDMNLQALDLLTSARFTRTFSEPSAHSLALLEENPSFSPHNLHQSIQRSPSIIRNSYKMESPSGFINGVTTTEGTKRPNNSTVMESKSTSQAPAKKSRVETRACPPLKVRKEKLGDRIANLQQMVAPFGKTDTASVLMEAIGYIKFLQNQVETLSVPYMNSSRNKTLRSAQHQQSTIQTDQEEGNYYNEETKRDLRSRGLCLVPLSCLSYITNDGCGGIWPHNDYHGCT